MIRVETAVGYVFEVESTDVEVGEQIEVPIPTVENPTEDSEVNDKVLNFMAQMYGLQKEWTQSSMGRYNAPDGLKHFPDYVLNMSDERLHRFLVRYTSAGAALVKHYSQKGQDQAEVRFRCIHRTQAEELQYLWWRAGVKTRIVWHKKMEKWLVQTSGAGAYVRIREFIRLTFNPRITKKMKGLDALVPIKFKLDEFPIKDRVVSLTEVGNGSSE